MRLMKQESPPMVLGMKVHQLLTLGLLTFIAASICSSSRQQPAVFRTPDAPHAVLGAQQQQGGGSAQPVLAAGSADPSQPVAATGGALLSAQQLRTACLAKGWKPPGTPGGTECPPCPEHEPCPEQQPCPEPEPCPSGCDAGGKYDLKHLDQEPSQDVIGPMQDDEALLLYAIVRGMRAETVVEIGGLDGYSGTNFLKAMEPWNGLLFTIDIDPVPIMHPERHRFIHRDVADCAPEDLEGRHVDLLFFDAHVLEQQMSFYHKLEDAGLLDNDTLIALHDTHLWPRPDWEKDPPEVPKMEEGEAHQPVERAMVNKLHELGWDAFMLHTPFSRLNQDFPKRHGVTIMQRFSPLSVPEYVMVAPGA